MSRSVDRKDVIRMTMIGSAAVGIRLYCCGIGSHGGDAMYGCVLDCCTIDEDRRRKTHIEAPSIDLFMPKMYE
jgi:hypothetical protein